MLIFIKCFNKYLWAMTKVSHLPIQSKTGTDYLNRHIQDNISANLEALEMFNLFIYFFTSFLSSQEIEKKCCKCAHMISLRNSKKTPRPKRQTRDNMNGVMYLSFFFTKVLQGHFLAAI